MINLSHLISSYVCLSALIVNSCQSSSPCYSNSSHEWLHYKQKYGKSYAPNEDYRRCHLFLAELKRIRGHNNKPNVTYKLSVDFMSDWNDSEFEKTMGPHKSGKLVKREAATEADQLHPFVSAILDQKVELPSMVDWRRSANPVGRVKFQLGCGACWAFATTGLLEGQQVARNFTSRLVELSEQQLIDCEGNRDICEEGGRAFRALEMVAEQDGIVSEQEYSYHGSCGDKCQAQGKSVVMRVKGFARLPAEDEHKMAAVVARYGPIAASMSLKLLRGYHSGIISGDNCGDANHEVLIVGYGSEAGLNYWLVKNSWSAEWGDAGYFKIKSGENVCGIASDLTIATF